MQIGRRGMSKSSLDTDNFNNAADIYVYPKTNEVFVADGYVNRRLIVLDADTGRFKRMWGAYGNAPDDAAPNKLADDGPGPQQFNLVHGVRVSNDGRVHVYDRRTLEELGGFGRIGRYAGEFIFLHNVGVDSKGNVYTTEVGNGRRVQKFLLSK